MSSPQTIRLATASPSTGATTAETLARLGEIAANAASQGADVLLLPEAYLGGYPRGADFGCKIGSRTAEGRDEFLRYFKAAVDLGDTVGDGAGAGARWVRRELPGPAAGPGGASEEVRGDGTREELERIARETGVFIVVGLVEKAGGSLYCAVVYVCPKLGTIGKRRKVQPTGTERLVWAAGSPSTLKAVSTTIKGIRLNLAAAICWENYMPLLRQTLYAQNINLYLAPTADGRDTWMGLMRTIALEGRCYVVSSNMCVRSQSNEGAAAKGQKREKSSGGLNGGAQVGVDEETNIETRDHPKGRRNSCFTEEGFEIALPPGPTKMRGSSGAPGHARRQSVRDEDGHEIVLGGSQDSSAVVLEEEEENHANAGAADFLSRGGSSIVSPMGEVLAGPQWEDDEGIIYADVDFEDCIRGRLDLDAAGSYSRNDSFKFSVEGLDLDPLPYE